MGRTLGVANSGMAPQIHLGKQHQQGCTPQERAGQHHWEIPRQNRPPDHPTKGLRLRAETPCARPRHKQRIQQSLTQRTLCRYDAQVCRQRRYFQSSETAQPLALHRHTRLANQGVSLRGQRRWSSHHWRFRRNKRLLHSVCQCYVRPDLTPHAALHQGRMPPSDCPTAQCRLPSCWHPTPW